MKRIGLLLTVVGVLLFTFTKLKADVNENDYFEIPSDFNAFTSSDLKGYTKPLFTTFGQGAQSNLFTLASYKDHYYIGMDISFSSTIIPSSQKSYQSELLNAFGDTQIMDNAMIKDGKIIRNVSGNVEEPTIYGGHSDAIYVVAPVAGGNPADSIYNTIVFNEGSDISTMASLPALQLVFGLPTRTELRLRYIGAGISDMAFSYFAVAVNQQVDQWFDLFDKEDKMALALNASYQSTSLAQSIDMGTWSFGVHFSKGFESGISLYSGLQLEDLSGTFKVVRENGYDANFYLSDGKTLKPASAIPNSQLEKYNEHLEARYDVRNNLYEEVRLLKPLEFDIESFTNWRLLVGATYDYGIMQLHIDLGYASQPFLNGGIRLLFKEWVNQTEVPTDN